MTTKTAAQRGTAVSVKSLAITAICLVLVYVFTAVVNIRLPFAPNGGLIHLGNVPLFVAAILFGKRTGMIAGGIGMARILPGRGRDLSKLGGAPHLHPGQFDSGGGRRHHHPGGH